MKHNLIIDEKQLKDFVSDFLPDLKENESFFVRLMTRAKYNESIRSDFDIRTFSCSKADLIRIIRSLECEIGSYPSVSKDEHLGTYVSINPRSRYESIKRATVLFSRNLSANKLVDPLILVSSAIRNSPSRQVYFDFDFDKVRLADVFDQLSKSINLDCMTILHTKNGIHAIADVAKIDESTYPNWNSNMRKIPGFDKLGLCGDLMIPIPGCNQFGFVPYLTPVEDPTFDS